VTHELSVLTASAAAIAYVTNHHNCVLDSALFSAVIEAMPCQQSADTTSRVALVQRVPHFTSNHLQRSEIYEIDVTMK